MEDVLNLTRYARKPFVVEAVEVTRENIEEVAKYVGDLKVKDDDEQTPYILVDKRLVPNIYRVYPGYFLTRMGDNIRCYTNRVFLEQFVPMTDQVSVLVDGLNNGLGDAPEVILEPAHMETGD